MTNPAQTDNAVLCDLARRMGEAEKSRNAKLFELAIHEGQVWLGRGGGLR